MPGTDAMLLEGCVGIDRLSYDQLGTGERWVRGGLGGIQLAGTAFAALRGLDEVAAAIQDARLQAQQALNTYASYTDRANALERLAANNATGRAGEQAVRAGYEIGDKTKQFINDRTRIPDGVTRTTIAEIKNVALPGSLCEY